MSHTHAVLDVPPTVFAAVRALLEQAGYEHTIYTDDANAERGDLLDMLGISLRARPGEIGANLTVSTLLSRRDKTGRVELALNGEIVQMDLDKAREVAAMLTGAIEAAISDELIYRFMVTWAGLDDERASAAMVAFRELRQGSRDRVHPS